MSASGFTFVTIAIFLVCGLLAIVNVIYFQIRYQKKVDAIIHGDNYIDGGWVFNSTRLMMYAHYCLFPGRAEKAGLGKQVSEIPKIIKCHLVLHWVLVLVSGFFLVVGSVMIDFYL